MTTISDLEKSAAEKLRRPSPDTAKEFGAKRDRMAARMNETMLDRPDCDQMIGTNNHAMMCDNHRNHVRFMESIFLSFDARVLVDTVLWVFRAYRSHGFQLAYWPAQLDTWVEILREDLSEEAFEEIYPFYDWMIVNQPAFSALSEQSASPGPEPAH